MSSNRGGFGQGPVHAALPLMSVDGDQAAYRRLDTRGGATSQAPSSAAPPRIRRRATESARWCPPWVRKMITEKASIEDVVHAALRRAAGHVNEETLLEVQTLLNELGRDPEGARHIRAAVTEDIIARVFTKGARS